MSEASREMSLDEWVRELPKHHRARREFSELHAHVTKLEFRLDEFMGEELPDGYDLGDDCTVVLAVEMQDVKRTRDALRACLTKFAKPLHIQRTNHPDREELVLRCSSEEADEAWALSNKHSMEPKSESLLTRLRKFCHEVATDPDQPIRYRDGLYLAIREIDRLAEAQGGEGDE